MKFNAGIIGCLVKILIIILILALIVVLAFVIVGNLKMSTLKFDTVKLGDATLGELGLGDQKVKTVVKAAYKLVNPDEKKLITDPFTETDGTSADTVFASIDKTSDMKPFYFSLLAKKAVYSGDPKIELTDGELGYILDRILSSGQEQEILRIANAYKMRTASSKITVENDKRYINLTLSMDVSPITSALPKIPVLNWFYTWPTEAYLTYSAEISATAEGAFTVVGNPSVAVNGLTSEESETIFTAVAKTKSIAAEEGKSYGQSVSDSLTAVICAAFGNIGEIANYGTDINENVNRNEIRKGAEGIKDGKIRFAKYESR